MSAARLITFRDPETLARAAADWLCRTLNQSDGTAAVALSGGSTPRRLYELLAQPPILADFPWDRVHWFWGDERFVPHDDPLSNFGMAWQAFLSRSPAPKRNIHPVPTEGLTEEDAARAYEAELKEFLGSDVLDPQRPLFAVNLLGIGADGHTASLFPGISALDEKDRWVVPVVGVKEESRISLTFQAIDSSRKAVFLVQGAEKREMLARLMAGETTIPAGRVRPVGELTVLADEAAAG